MEEKIVEIINEMAEFLSVAQTKKLQEVLVKSLTTETAEKKQISNEEYKKLFWMPRG